MSVSINLSGVALPNPGSPIFDGLNLAGTRSTATSMMKLYTNDFDDGTYTEVENGVSVIDLRYGAITQTLPHTGAYSMEMQWTADSGEFSELRYDLGARYEEVIVEYWLYTPTVMTMAAPQGSVTNQKFARFWTGPETGGSSGDWYTTTSLFEKIGIDWWASNPSGIEGYMKLSVSGVWAGHPATPTYEFYNTSKLGTWRKIKIHAKAVTSSNLNDSAFFQVWSNDVVIIPKTFLYEYANNDSANAAIIGNMFDSGKSGHGFRWFYLNGATNRYFAQDTVFRIDGMKIFGKVTA